MKNSIKIGLFLFMFLLFPLNAHAVSFSVSKSQDNLKPGNEFTTSINAEVESNANLKEFNLVYTFDSDRFQYISSENAPGVTINPSSNGFSVKYEGDPLNQNFTVVNFRFKVKDNAKTGNSSIGLTKASCTSDTSCHSNNSSISVSALSTDASLKSLKIPNCTLSPNFNKNIYEYKTSIKDITEVQINAVPSDSSSKIQITENYKALKKGENVVKIVVQAENGESKTYTININVDLTPTNEELLKQDATLKHLDIKNFKIDFKSDEKKYYLNVPYKTEKLSIKAVPTNPNAKINIDSTKLKVGKNTITITVTSEDGKNTVKYGIIVNRDKQKKEIVKTCPDVTSKKEWIMFYSSTFITFTVGLILGYLLCKFKVLEKIKNKLKKKKKKDKKKEEKKEEVTSDTIELDSTKVLDELKKKR